MKLIEKIKYKYRSIENKKMFYSAIAATVTAILVIILVGNILKSGRLPDQGVTTEVLQLESSAERETTRMLREETTEQSTEQPAQTPPPQTATVEETTAKPVQATVPETEHRVSDEIIERETIPFEEIVVETGGLLKDDVEEKPVEVIDAPAQYSVESSTNTNQEDFADCIDVSYHNGTIDWNAVKASGIDYAFIRIGYRGYETGKLGKDIKFEQNIQNAKRAGVKVGVYFFSQAISEQEALEEASVTLNYLRGYRLDLPVVMDWETDKGYRTYSGLSPQRLTNIISVFCDTIASNGFKPMIYMNRSDFGNRVYYQTLAAKYKLWVAWYFDRYYSENLGANRFTYGDNIPKLPYQYDVWQYTSKGSVNGIKTRVDMNVMFPGAENIYEPKLNITNSTFTTSLAHDINLLSGVSAVGENGRDAMSRVTVTIKNSSGNEVSKSDALNRSGVYTIYYRMRDTSLEKSATLFVRAIPQFKFEGEEWTDYNARIMEFDYDVSASKEQNYNYIKNKILSSVSAYYYDTYQGYGKQYPIKNMQITGIESIYSEGAVSDGQYKVLFKADDGQGLNNQRTVIVVIHKNIEEPTEEIGDETVGTNTEHE